MELLEEVLSGLDRGRVLVGWCLKVKRGHVLGSCGCLLWMV